MERICPRCGASSQKTPFVEEFCLPCHLESKQRVLPTSVEIVICPTTGKIRVSGNPDTSDRPQRYAMSKKKIGEKWIKPDNSLLKQIIKRPFKRAGFECKYKMKDNFVTILFEGVDGGIIEYKHPLNIIYKKLLSPMAGRAAGGYFEAIIQLRGDRLQIERYRKKILKALDRHTFIAKEEKLPEGIDIYVGQKEQLQEILRDMKLKTVRSKTLSGQRRDTKRLYRDTFLVRLEAKD